jgi:hypothetical protein
MTDTNEKQRATENIKHSEVPLADEADFGDFGSAQENSDHVILQEQIPQPTHCQEPHISFYGKMVDKNEVQIAIESFNHFEDPLVDATDFGEAQIPQPSAPSAETVDDDCQEQHFALYGTITDKNVEQTDMKEFNHSKDPLVDDADFGDFGSAPENSENEIIQEQLPQPTSAYAEFDDNDFKEHHIVLNAKMMDKDEEQTAMQEYKHSDDHLVDDSDFGDFGSAPEILENVIIQEQTPQPTLTCAEFEDDDFGDFDAAPMIQEEPHPITQRDPHPTTRQETDHFTIQNSLEDDFGDFGDFSEIPATEAHAPQQNLSLSNDPIFIMTQSVFKKLFSRYAAEGESDVGCEGNSVEADSISQVLVS